MKVGSTTKMYRPVGIMQKYENFDSIVEYSGIMKNNLGINDNNTGIRCKMSEYYVYSLTTQTNYCYLNFSAGFQLSILT